MLVSDTEIAGLDAMEWGFADGLERERCVTCPLFMLRQFGTFIPFAATRVVFGVGDTEAAGSCEAFAADEASGAERIAACGEGDLELDFVEVSFCKQREGCHEREADPGS